MFNQLSNNKRVNIHVFSLRKYVIPSILLFFTIGLMLFSNSNLSAAKAGLKLWAYNVVPALFPFFVATDLLSYTNICEKISNIFSKIMRPLFNVPGCGAYAFILGLISGYPVGAKIAVELRNSGNCSKDEGNRILAFTNNSGPLFIIGTVGVSLFRNTSIGILLLISHILSSITVGIILGLTSKKNKISTINSGKSFLQNKKYCTFSNLGEILGNSIFSSIKTILMIGGFVVIFSCLISILNESNIFSIINTLFNPLFNTFRLNTSFIKPILTGIIELTNGMALVCNIPGKNIAINILACAFLLGFGGISVLLQVFSIVSKSDLSIKTYLYGKILQGIIACFYTYILICNFSFFNFNL